jgi:hypothetical protein
VRIFDFVFVAVAFISIFVAVSIGVEAWRRRFNNALRVGLAFGAALAVYLGIVIAVSLATPQETLALRDERCYDDWCLAVDNVAQTDAESVRLYTISFRLTSRAKRVTQRELGLIIYLLDAGGRRHDPLADSAAVPFDVALKPGESTTAVRTFALQDVSGPVRLVITREGFFRFPGLFIIGDESSLFHKPLVVPLPGQ